MPGWLVDCEYDHDRAPPSGGVWWWCGRRFLVGGCGCDTLLGPEGSGPPSNPSLCVGAGMAPVLGVGCGGLVVQWQGSGCLTWFGLGGLGLACLCFENYTVDASIFVALSF